PRFANDVGHHHGERAVAAAEKNRPVPPLDQRARDVPTFLDAPRDEKLAGGQDLVERVDDLVVHALPVAVDDDRDPLARRQHALVGRFAITGVITPRLFRRGPIFVHAFCHLAWTRRDFGIVTGRWGEVAIARGPGSAKTTKGAPAV